MVLWCRDRIHGRGVTVFVLADSSAALEGDLPAQDMEEEMTWRRKFWSAWAIGFGVPFAVVAVIFALVRDWLALGLLFALSLIVTVMMVGSFKYLGVF